MAKTKNRLLCLPLGFSILKTALATMNEYALFGKDKLRFQGDKSEGSTSSHTCKCASGLVVFQNIVITAIYIYWTVFMFVAEPYQMTNLQDI